MKKAKLNPCLFCGSEDVEISKHNYDINYSQDTVDLAVTCNNCDAYGPTETVNIDYNNGTDVTNYEPTKLEVSDKWNKKITLTDVKEVQRKKAQIIKYIQGDSLELLPIEDLRHIVRLIQLSLDSKELENSKI